MGNENLPAMSVVVITPDRYETVRKTVRHLRAQNVKDQLEIVLVAPSGSDLRPDESEMREFLRYRVVEVADMTSTARARAAGVQHASAPVVAFVEDHAFPGPGWAEALIEAHKDGWAAVGPVIANANPRSVISWVNLLVEYAPWIEPLAGGVAEHLPGHNGSYKRVVLLEYGDHLEAMLDAESILHWDLQAKGHQLYLESKARTFHQNVSVPLATVSLRFNGGRLFASSRARQWPVWRRLLFTAASPLIPLVRAVRIGRELLKPGRPRHVLVRVLPALMAGLVIDGAGEMVGYAFGAGNAMAILSDMEFHRHRYLASSDKRMEVAQ
jgi:glycosyltransferase involved in cell wall biosynthesis